MSTSETSSDLCHCLKHSLAPRPSLPSSPSECGSRPLSECLPGLLEGSFPARPSKVPLLTAQCQRLCWQTSLEDLWGWWPRQAPRACSSVDHFSLLSIFGKANCSKRLQKLERVGRRPLSSSGLGCWPSLTAFVLPGSLSQGDQGGSLLCCPLYLT